MMKTTRRESGFTLYLVAGAIIAGAAGLLFLKRWDSGRLDHARQAGYEAAMAEVKTQRLAADNRSLLLQREQIITLTNELTEARNAFDAVQRSRAAALDRARRDGQRVRLAASGDELDRRVGGAECSVIRTFAAGSFRTAASCRDHLAEIGLGAGGLVESSASAHYEHQRAQALMKFSMPRSPFQPKE